MRVSTGLAFVLSEIPVEWLSLVPRVRDLSWNIFSVQPQPPAASWDALPRQISIQQEHLLGVYPGLWGWRAASSPHLPPGSHTCRLALRSKIEPSDGFWCPPVPADVVGRALSFHFSVFLVLLSVPKPETRLPRFFCRQGSGLEFRFRQ